MSMSHEAFDAAEGLRKQGKDRPADAWQRAAEALSHAEMITRDYDRFPDGPAVVKIARPIPHLVQS